MSPKPLSEHTPLLSGSSASSEENEAPLISNPLPQGQVTLLTITRLAEPLAFTVLFPFVNSMVLKTGSIKAEEVGYYVGAIESVFSLVQMVFRARILDLICG
jgi:hypothetical protein